MLVGATAFVAFALQHPEMSSPENGTQTALLHAAFPAAAPRLPAAPRKR